MRMGSVGSARPRSRNRAHLDLYRAVAAGTWRCFHHGSAKPASSHSAQSGSSGIRRLQSGLEVPEGAQFASAVDFKTPVRAQIEKDGYTIIVEIGDQPSDLLGGDARNALYCPIGFIGFHG